jgi:hypothetical protein
MGGSAIGSLVNGRVRESAAIGAISWFTGNITAPTPILIDENAIAQ